MDPILRLVGIPPVGRRSGPDRWPRSGPWIAGIAGSHRMSRRTIGLVLSSLAVAALGHRPVTAGQLTTPLQTQSIPMTPTDWGPATPGLTDPLVFRQFDPSLGTLDAVELTLKTTIHNDFILVFTTHTPTTLDVATTETSNPNILS